MNEKPNDGDKLITTPPSFTLRPPSCEPCPSSPCPSNTVWSTDEKKGTFCLIFVIDIEDYFTFENNSWLSVNIVNRQSLFSINGQSLNSVNWNSLYSITWQSVNSLNWQSRFSINWKSVKYCKRRSLNSVNWQSGKYCKRTVIE